MQDVDFKNWLHLEKQYSDKAARDVVSRCRRVENILEVSLDEILADEDSLAKTIAQLNSVVASHLRPGAGTLFPAAALRTAIRLYSNYKGIGTVLPPAWRRLPKQEKMQVAPAE